MELRRMMTRFLLFHQAQDTTVDRRDLRGKPSWKDIAMGANDEVDFGSGWIDKTRAE
jgi:hypothetical protein